MKATRYDVFSDIHGERQALETALVALGYENHAGTWRHASAHALFVGDFADRGPDPFGVYEIIMAMTEAKSAQAVIGNHDFSFAAMHTEVPGKPGKYLRSHSAKHVSKAHPTFSQAMIDPARAAEIIRWIRRLPFFIATADYRIVHACPHADALARLDPWLTADKAIGEDDTIFADLAEYKDIGDDRALVICGPEFDLPNGQTYFDADGHERSAERVAWWKDATFHHPTPTFFGHYAIMHGPRIFVDTNSVCVDAGCGKGGPLAVYSFEPGQPLSSRHFSFFSA